MRDIVKPGVVLLIITVIAAACLGVVYGITEAPIKAQREKTQNEAMTKILPSAVEFKPIIASGEASPEATMTVSVDGTNITDVYTGYNGDNLEGFVLGVVTNKGYSGRIKLFVGVSGDGVIEGVSIVEHGETPGLGANAANPKFINQFVKKSGVLTVTKSAPSENEIEAITSATITSNAVTDAVNEALKFYDETLR